MNKFKKIWQIDFFEKIIPMQPIDLFKALPESRQECPICLENLLSNKEPIAAHPDNGQKHPFHLRCIRQIPPPFLCPCCRVTLDLSKWLPPPPKNPNRSLKNRVGTPEGLGILMGAYLFYNYPIQTTLIIFAGLILGILLIKQEEAQAADPPLEDPLDIV